MITYISCFYGDDIRQLNDKNNAIGPFGEFNIRWYMLIGTALILNTILQILNPYFGTILEFIKLSI